MPENSEQTLGDIIVTAEDYASTYFHGRRDFHEYNTNWDLAAHCRRPGNFVRARNISSHDKLRYQRAINAIQHWMKGKLRPAVQGVLDLHDLGVFSTRHEEKRFDNIDIRRLEPLTARHPHFELLCLLSSLIYWSGSRLKAFHHYKSRDTSTSLTFETDGFDEETAPIVRQLLETLATKSWITSQKGRGKGRIKGAGYRLSRLLGLLGTDLGRKTRTGGPYPNVIQCAHQTLQSDESTEDEKRTAKEILRDFINIFFLRRVHCERTQKIPHVGRLLSHVDDRVHGTRKSLFGLLLDEAGFQTQKRQFWTGHSRKLTVTAIRFPNMDELFLRYRRREFTGRIHELIRR